MSWILVWSRETGDWAFISYLEQLHCQIMLNSLHVALSDKHALPLFNMVWMLFVIYWSSTWLWTNVSRLSLALHKPNTYPDQDWPHSRFPNRPFIPGLAGRLQMTNSTRFLFPEVQVVLFGPPWSGRTQKSLQFWITPHLCRSLSSRQL